MGAEKVILKTDFLKQYSAEGRIENTEAPELNFMRGLCGKNPELIKKSWSEKPFYGYSSSVYMPVGVYTGYSAIETMIKEWFEVFEAVTMQVIPVTQLSSNGRSASEVVVRMERSEDTLEVPMCIVAELHNKESVENVRIYHTAKWTRSLLPCRKHIFRSDATSKGSDNCLTGGMREYFNALHTPSLERLLGMVDHENICYGGYRPDYLEPIHHGIEAFQKIYEHMVTDIPSRLTIRWETITVKDNIWIVEWNGFTNPCVHSYVPCPPIGESEEEAQCGVAVYEFNEEQKLIRVSICDEYGLQYPLEDYPELAGNG